MRQLCGASQASQALRLICTSRRKLGSTLPECIKVDLKQLALDDAMDALQHYSSDAAIDKQVLKQLSILCQCNPYAISKLGCLLRDADNLAEAVQVRHSCHLINASQHALCVPPSLACLLSAFGLHYVPLALIFVLHSIRPLCCID